MALRRPLPFVFRVQTCFVTMVRYYWRIHSSPSPSRRTSTAALAPVSLAHTLAASCPCTSIMSRAASRWRFSCARARRRRAPRSASSSSTWRGASVGTGRAPGSHSGGTATTDGPRPWRGARRTASTTSSDWRAMPCCTTSPTTSATISRCAAPRPAPTGCGASQPSTTPPVRGTANAGSSPGWRLEAPARAFDARYIATSLGGDAGPSLRGPVLRPRPGREPHQAAQGPARLRPDLLPEPDRQPDPPRPAHRKARSLEGHSRNPRAGMETGTTEDARRKRVEQRRFRFDDGCLRLWRSTVREIEPHQGLDIWPDTWSETRMQIRQEQQSGV